MNKKKVVYGYQQYRFRNNPEEKRFSDAWHKQQAGNTLGHLLYNNSRTPEEPPEAEQHVAATVIQWLGSPVGQAFLSDLGYTKERVRIAIDPAVKKRNKRVERLKNKAHQIQKILRDINIELLNIDNPDG